MSAPRPRWNLDAAPDLLAQGYSVGTAKRSGFHPAHLRGRARGLRLEG